MVKIDSNFRLLFILMIFFPIEASFSQDSTLIKLPLMTWYEIPNSRLDAVKPNPLPPNWGGFESVMSAWSGGAFDSRRDNLIIWGGGHSDYSGNEIYIFSLNSLKWTRFTEPSSDVGGNEASGEYPDGKPRARHTYNYIQYLTSVDKFFTFGGHGLYPSGQIGTNKTHSFDFVTKEWTRNAATPAFGIGAISAVDLSTGYAWIHGTGDYGTARLASYDAQKDTWEVHTDYDNTIAYDYTLTADIDPKRRKFIAIGGGHIYSWDISDPNNVTKTNLQTTGDTEVINIDSPGFEYDPIGDRFVAWRQGLSLYTLDMDSRIWTKITPQGSNPGPPNSNGTFGRFRYVPSLNGFILVNGVDKNVFFVKISYGSAGPQIPKNLRVLK